MSEYVLLDIARGYHSWHEFFVSTGSWELDKRFRFYSERPRWHEQIESTGVQPLLAALKYAEAISDELHIPLRISGTVIAELVRPWTTSEFDAEWMAVESRCYDRKQRWFPARDVVESVIALVLASLYREAIDAVRESFAEAC